MIQRIGDNAFALHTKNTSYVFRVMNTGQLEHLYYGNKISINTEEPLIEKYVDLPGNTVAYNQNTMEYSLETIKLEMSSYGKGDIREPFVEIVFADGNYTNDFTFKSIEAIDGKDEFKTLPGSYFDDKESYHLKVVMEDKNYNVDLEIHYYIFEKTDVITRSAKLINKSGKTIVLKRLMSLSIDLPGNDYIMTSFNGGWANEMNKRESKVSVGKHINSSYTGTSSSRANPFVMLSRQNTAEDSGECFGFNLIYSGNHYEALESSMFDESRFVCGINPQSFSFELKADEEFEAPEAVMTYSAKGYNALSHNMHDFVRNNIVRGVWKKKERPILLNSWEANYFDITEDKLVELAKKGKELGIELFVMDDGWFGKRDDDTSSLGDWHEDNNKLPNGIKGLAKKINSLGLEFGIWIEPEMISKNSNLYSEHPEWVIEAPGSNHSEGRNQCILDLTNDDVCEYMINAMSKIFESGNISYVKWDMNRIFSDYYSKNLSPQKQSEVSHRYAMGFYKMAKTLTKKYPEILFEGCCGGGNRFDLGMLCYFPQIWASDNTDALCRANIQNGYSYGYPMSVVSAHVSDCPNHQTYRTIPMKTRYNVACFGVLGYECDLTKMSEYDLDAIKNQIKEYKKWRHVLQLGDFYRIADNNKFSWTCVSKNKTKAVSMVMTTISNHTQQLLNVKVKGLEEQMQYEFCGKNIKYTVFGNMLINAGINTNPEYEEYKEPHMNKTKDFNSQLYYIKKHL